MTASSPIVNEQAMFGGTAPDVTSRRRRASDLALSGDTQGRGRAFAAWRSDLGLKFLNAARRASIIPAS